MGRNSRRSLRRTEAACPYCGGNGYTYFAYHIPTGTPMRCTPIAFECMARNEEAARAKGDNYYQWMVDFCPKCDGRGKVRIINQ